MSKNKGKVLQLNITSLYLSFSVKFFIFYHHKSLNTLLLISKQLRIIILEMFANHTTLILKFSSIL